MKCQLFVKDHPKVIGHYDDFEAARAAAREQVGFPLTSYISPDGTELLLSGNYTPGLGAVDLSPYIMFVIVPDHPIDYEALNEIPPYLPPKPE